MSVHLEKSRRGGLTKAGRICIDALNEYAALDAAGLDVPNHQPASPRFWFHGLASEVIAWGALRAHLTPEADALIVEMFETCSCEDEDCYACAFGRHSLCTDVCKCRDAA